MRIKIKILILLFVVYSYANADGTIVTNNYIADENGFRSSLAPSNGPLLPVVGKAPKVPVAIAHADIAPYPAAVPVRGENPNKQQIVFFGG